MDIKKQIQYRLIGIYVLIAIAFLVVFGKTVYLQTAERSQWEQFVSKRTFKEVVIQPSRGNIYSADGKLLATSISHYRMLIDFDTEAFDHERFLNEKDTIALRLSEIFGDRTPLEYQKLLEYGYEKKRRYQLIKKDINISELIEVKKIPFFAAGKFKSGFIEEHNNERMLPHNDLARRTIGFFSDGRPVAGFERAYNNYLKGIEGRQYSQLISESKNEWKPMNYGVQLDAIDGRDIITSIDVRLQDISEKILLRTLQKYEAEAGTIILMEAKTGEIKVNANLKKNNKNQYTDIRNFAIGESYEPGSTFKLASLIALLEDGYVTLDDTIDTGDGIERVTQNYTIKDSRLFGYGKISVKNAFEVSSNIGISKLIRRYYETQPQKFINRLYSMGLGKKLNLAFEGEVQPFIRTPENKKWWPDGSLSQISIGYEVNLAPIQLLTFYNAVANNGVMVKPKFVKAIAFRGQIEREFETKVINPAIATPATIKKVQEALKGVVENGTARNIKNNMYSIAGKTGTAQIVQGNQGYRGQDDQVYYSASFAGYFPADNPKYTCLVVIKNPKDQYYGSAVAAPAFKALADKVYATDHKIHQSLDGTHNRLSEIPYSKNANKYDILTIAEALNIPTNGQQDLVSDWVVTKKTAQAIKLNNRSIKQKQMPLLIGMGAKDAIYIAEKLGMKVVLRGKGVVRGQSIKAGTKINQGEQLLLELS